MPSPVIVVHVGLGRPLVDFPVSLFLSVLPVFLAASSQYYVHLKFAAVSRIPLL
ncbi:unnamed protein product, partial [Citrullus colocynthis]